MCGAQRRRAPRSLDHRLQDGTGGAPAGVSRFNMVVSSRSVRDGERCDPVDGGFHPGYHMYEVSCLVASHQFNT